VSVTHLPTPAEATPPRVAFAVPRKVGTAVVRNRLRRQVRGHLGRRQASGETLAPGAYLIALAPGAAELGPDVLLGDLDRCLDRVTGVRS
jgi:ribonuclease P protein component